MAKSDIRISYQPPSNGWLTVLLTVDAVPVEIDASDVPNNPIGDLVAALDLAAQGVPSSVWWHLEPGGYFMYFTPHGNDVQLRLDFERSSETARASTVLAFQGSPKQVLLPFWRFVREFQSHDFQEPHWPPADYTRMDIIKANIIRQRPPR